MISLRIDTYEDSSRTPVLSHTFYGSSRADVMAIVEAHAEYDQFFRASITSRRFRGMSLTNRLTWGRA